MQQDKIGLITRGLSTLAFTILHLIKAKRDPFIPLSAKLFYPSLLHHISSTLPPLLPLFPL